MSNFVHCKEMLIKFNFAEILIFKISLYIQESIKREALIMIDNSGDFSFKIKGIQTQKGQNSSNGIKKLIKTNV